MAKQPTKRTPPPADVKAARKLIDEVPHMRAEIRLQKKDIDRLNREMLAMSRENRRLKEKLAAKPAPKTARKPDARKAS